MSQQSWYVMMLTGFAGIASVLGLIWAVILVLTHGRRSPQAARLVWAALGLKAFKGIVWPFVSIMLVRYLTPSEMAQVTVTMQPVIATLDVIFLLLLVNAAFVARDSPNNHVMPEANREASVPPAPIDPNPYSSPQ